MTLVKHYIKGKKIWLVGSKHKRLEDIKPNFEKQHFKIFLFYFFIEL